MTEISFGNSETDQRLKLERLEIQKQALRGKIAGYEEERVKLGKQWSATTDPQEEAAYMRQAGMLDREISACKSELERLNTMDIV